MKKSCVEVLNKKQHPKIFKWLEENVYVKKHGGCYVKFSEMYQEYFVIIDKKTINADIRIKLDTNITNIKYKFGIVCGDFNCSECVYLNSFKNVPEVISGAFFCGYMQNVQSMDGFPKDIKGFIFMNFSDCRTISINPKDGVKYDNYFNMWVRLLKEIKPCDVSVYLENYYNCNKLEFYTRHNIIPVGVNEIIKLERLLKK